MDHLAHKMKTSNSSLTRNETKHTVDCRTWGMTRGDYNYKAYYKTKKAASLRYFDTYFIQNIRGTTDIRLHVSISM